MGSEELKKNAWKWCPLNFHISSRLMYSINKQQFRNQHTPHCVAVNAVNSGQVWSVTSQQWSTNQEVKQHHSLGTSTTIHLFQYSSKQTWELHVDKHANTRNVVDHFIHFHNILSLNFNNHKWIVTYLVNQKPKTKVNTIMKLN